MNPVAVDYIAALLRARVALTQARRLAPGQGGGARDGVTDSPRLLQVISGAIHYQIEDRTHRVAAPGILFVPTHARRQWQSDPRTVVLHINYDTNPAIPCPLPLQLLGSAARKETQAFRHILSLHPAGDLEDELLIEAEVKALLARVLLRAKPLDAAATISPRARSIEAAVRWLQQNYAQADPLAGLHERAGLSEAYFRATFRRLIGMSPRAHLNALRMQTARFLLIETTSPVKQIAREVGFADPAYFSRCYHAFWKKWPTDERGA